MAAPRVAAPMRVLVTGPLNPFGQAVVEALAGAGHDVRAFGVPAGEDPFHGLAHVECFPGDVALGGSIEPVAAECKAIVHCANLDAPGSDKHAHAVHLERGTLYTRYGAERDPAERFVALFPATPPRLWSKALEQAEEHVRRTHPVVAQSLLRVADPQEAAQKVVQLVSQPAQASRAAVKA